MSVQFQLLEGGSSLAELDTKPRIAWNQGDCLLNDVRQGAEGIRQPGESLEAACARFLETESGSKLYAEYVHWQRTGRCTPADEPAARSFADVIHTADAISQRATDSARRFSEHARATVPAQMRKHFRLVEAGDDDLSATDRIQRFAERLIDRSDWTMTTAEATAKALELHPEWYSDYLAERAERQERREPDPAVAAQAQAQRFSDEQARPAGSDVVARRQAAGDVLGQVTGLATAKQATTPGLSLEQATSQVLTERPELYTSYKRALSGREY